MSESIWAGVQVHIQSALGADKTVTAITKANPGVASSTTHGFTDGQYIVQAALGMNEVNDRVFRISGAAANAYNLEGEDTTLYNTFSSGTANLITYGISATSFTDLSPGGGDSTFINNSTIHQLFKTQIPGPTNPISYDFDSKWDPSDPGLIALKAATQVQGKRAVRFTFLNGYKALFTGYVSCNLLPQGSAFDLVKTKVSITMNGAPTYYLT